MNNLMSNFSGLALSRMEMKKVKGGMCTIKYNTKDGGCGSITQYVGGTQSQSLKIANKNVGRSINGSSTITGYSMTCN